MNKQAHAHIQMQPTVNVTHAPTKNKGTAIHASIPRV